MIEGNAERMVGLIEGLLRLSQLGRGAIHRIPLSMEELARDVLRDVGSGTRAEIRVGRLPECNGDPAILRQVWANLIGNALKYSRTRDAARVEIGWDAQHRAYFVRDNGVGFDMQYAAKLFGAFERLHGEAEFEGSGIGLAIVQRILERHGGKIWADAAPDRGATFWFTVPAAASAKKR
jgi:light-regulated signal transduction histidine kinase (bacteriophytochrome)